MEFRILGPLEIAGPAGEIKLGSGKQRALLALLLLHANDVVPAGRLIELLWPEAPPADAAKALQVHVSRLRRALAQADVIRTRPGGYLLELHAGNFDLPRFEQRAGEARSLLARRRAAGLLVGRERELGELLSALEDAAAGRGRLFVVSGESGAGKTRLADELASRAKDAGARVLWGRCWKRGGAPPYWPWTQALRSLPGLPALDAAAGEDERFALYVEVAAGLRRASAEQPLLVVLDDLDRADELSLLLL